MSSFQKLLEDIDIHLPDRPATRDFLKSPSHKNVGNAYAYLNKSRSDPSTGPIVAIKNSLSLDQTRLIPAMSHSWVAENYRSVVAAFFAIPPDLVGKRHVAGGVFKASSSRVKRHSQARVLSLGSPGIVGETHMFFYFLFGSTNELQQ